MPNGAIDGKRLRWPAATWVSGAGTWTSAQLIHTATLKYQDIHTTSVFQSCHLLQQFPHEDTPRTPIVLPQRQHHEHYSRQAVPAQMLVPEVY